MAIPTLGKSWSTKHGMNSVTRIMRFAVRPVVLLKRGDNNKKIALGESKTVFSVLYRLSSGLNNLRGSAIPDIRRSSLTCAFACDITAGIEASCDWLLARYESTLPLWHTGR